MKFAEGKKLNRPEKGGGVYTVGKWVCRGVPSAERSTLSLWSSFPVTVWKSDVPRDRACHLSSVKEAHLRNEVKTLMCHTA